MIVLVIFKGCEVHNPPLQYQYPMSDWLWIIMQPIEIHMFRFLCVEFYRSCLCLGPGSVCTVKCADDDEDNNEWIGGAGKINLSGLIIYYLLFTKVIMFGLNVCQNRIKLIECKWTATRGGELILYSGGSSLLLVVLEPVGRRNNRNWNGIGN